MKLDYPVFDSDNHLYETEESFTRHLPREYANEILYVDVRGRTKIAFRGQISEYIPNPTFARVAAPGAWEKWHREGNPEGKSMRELTEVIPCDPAFQQAKPRLELMDRQGLAAMLLFPTLASALEARFYESPKLLNAATHAFNQWMQEEWGFANADRIFAVPPVSLVDPQNAVTELEWCLEQGAKMVLVRPGPVPSRLGGRSPGLPDFDPFWARVAEARITVAMHSSDTSDAGYTAAWTGGLGDEEYLPFQRGAFELMLDEHGRLIQDTVAALVCDGLFTRHPNVRIAIVENGSTWVDGLLSRFDMVYRRNARAFGGEHPAEIFRRHFWISPYYEDDVVALARTIGADHVIFGSDFPHPEGLGNPLDFLHEIEELSAQDQQQIMSGNLQGLLKAGAPG